LVVLENVTKIYKMGSEEIKALDDLSLEIRDGEILVVMGPSGSGKSTFLHLVGCLDKPTSGKILIDGKDISNLRERELARIRNRTIGFVFQQFNLLPRLTALENVELPMIYAGIPKRKRVERAKKLLEMVGLSDRMKHRPSQLSGGQQQRVAIARALANDPKIILADEPTGNLDTKSGEVVINILRDLNRKGLTIVIVTHDPDITIIAHRVIHLKDGKIIKEEVRV